MSKAIQRMVNNNGVYVTTQFQLTTEDITLSTGVVADVFFSCKGSDDTVYILCYKGGSSNDIAYARIVKITSNGTKTISVCYWSMSGWDSVNSKRKIMLNRAEDKLFFTVTNENGYLYVYSVDISKVINGNIILSDVDVVIEKPDTIEIIFSLYRDLYIWNIQTSILHIRSQSSPYNSLSAISESAILSMSVDINNQAWIVSPSFIHKLVYSTSITKTTTAFTIDTFKYVKQSLIDKWGDLILITNNLTTSTLIKINLIGTPSIISTIDLGGVRYNLNTDKDGTYFYSNGLNTWKIPANGSQGSVFSALGNHTIIRGTGMTTYNNDITGYMVSSLSSVGC